MTATHTDEHDETAEDAEDAEGRHLRFLEEYQHLASPFGSGGFGAKAEQFARFFGTPKFLIGQTLVVAAWIVINATHLVRFDLYPFILLNLAFSLQAAYAAPLILLAQTRQADRDKEVVERDREVNARALAETEYLAREIAAVRLAVEQKADREDIVEPLERLAQSIERLQAVEPD